jgi:hypothetical protein
MPKISSFSARQMRVLGRVFSMGCGENGKQVSFRNLTGLRQAFVPQRLSYRTRGFWRFTTWHLHASGAGHVAANVTSFRRSPQTSLFDEVFQWTAIEFAEFQ